MSYQIDNQSPFSKFFTSVASANLPDFNFKLFETGDLKAGNHTVTLNLTACINQTLIIDYILYAPSFFTLATMPNLTSASTSSPATTTSTGSSGNISSPHRPPVGAIAGGVVAGLAALALLSLLLFFWRGKRGQKSKAVPEKLDMNVLDSYYPEGICCSLIFFIDRAYSFMKVAYAPVRWASPMGTESSPPISEQQFSTSEKGSVRLSYHPGYGYTTSESDRMSIGSSSFSSSAALSPAPSQRQTEIRRRMAELQQLVEESEEHDNGGMAAAVGGNGSVTELRRHIQLLTEENEHLAFMTVPPAYEATVSEPSTSLSPRDESLKLKV